MENQCLICNFPATNAVKLLEHAKQHMGVAPYDCCVCGEAFNSNESLAVHMNLHWQEISMYHI